MKEIKHETPHSLHAGRRVLYRRSIWRPMVRTGGDAMTVIIAFLAGVAVATCIIAAGILYAPMAALYIAGGFVAVAVLALVVFGKVE